MVSVIWLFDGSQPAVDRKCLEPIHKPIAKHEALWTDTLKVQCGCGGDWGCVDGMGAWSNREGADGQGQRFATILSCLPPCDDAQTQRNDAQWTPSSGASLALPLETLRHHLTVVGKLSQTHTTLRCFLCVPLAIDMGPTRRRLFKSHTKCFPQPCIRPAPKRPKQHKLPEMDFSNAFEFPIHTMVCFVCFCHTVARRPTQTFSKKTY